mgnify:CR=1 FL=1
MEVKVVRTRKVTVDSITLHELLDETPFEFGEGNVLAITSKIVSICQGRTINNSVADKLDLIKSESDYFLPVESNKYGICLTIKDNRLIPSAGIDESNSNGHYVLWPADAQRVANDLRDYLISRFGCRRAGVIITDSTTAPLRSGVTGICLVHSGFKAVRNLIGTPDIFGCLLKVTKVNVADGLAAAAVLCMGESNEQTPLAIVSKLPFVDFQDREPTSEEIAELKIATNDDLYGSLLNSVSWCEGDSNASVFIDQKESKT